MATAVNVNNITFLFTSAIKYFTEEEISDYKLK